MRPPVRAPAAQRGAAMPLARTAVATLLLALLSFAATQWITHDFQVWTAEGARRLDVALHPVPAPKVGVEGPAIDAGSTLQDVLAHGGTPTIVDFMYTRCITVCTALGSVFQQLQGDILQDGVSNQAASVRLLSLSLDAEHDKPEVLAAYSALLHADSRVWRFARLAGADGRNETQALLRLYQATVIADGFGGYEHNAALLVLDPRGRLVRIFDYAEAKIALDYAMSLNGSGAP
jgi:protein SCO1/2